MNDRTANIFMLQAIQEWGQSESERLSAVQELLNAAGFDAVATCWPVFGGIWQKTCTGKDGEEATTWLQALTDNLKRGEYNSEVDQIEQAVKKRRESQAVAEEKAPF